MKATCTIIVYRYIPHWHNKDKAPGTRTALGRAQHAAEISGHVSCIVENKQRRRIEGSLQRVRDFTLRGFACLWVVAHPHTMTHAVYIQRYGICILAWQGLGLSCLQFSANLVTSSGYGSWLQPFLSDGQPVAGWLYILLVMILRCSAYYLSPPPRTFTHTLTLFQTGWLQHYYVKPPMAL